MVSHEILTLHQGHPRYAAVIERAAADPVMTAQMWQDAELEWELSFDTYWTVVLKSGTCDIMAMAAFRPEVVDGEQGWLCRANYHPIPYRNFAWYPVAFMARHLLTRTMPCVTYVFRAPKPIHQAAGWRVTDSGISFPDGEGPGKRAYRWFEMKRAADPS